MRALGQVARLTNCAVCLLAHVDKTTSRNKKAEGGEGYSGSTAWHNSARSRIFMTRGDDGLLTLDADAPDLVVAQGQTLHRLALSAAGNEALRSRYLGEATSAVYLIRPDQHVAARWEKWNADAVASALATALALE